MRKPKRPSRSSRPPEAPGRGLPVPRLRIRAVLVALVAAAGILALLGTVVWFATASWRADQAQRYDTESRALLARHDVDGSYQQARLAYAISPEPDRALSLGSLAYLRGDYARALDHFAAADGPFGALGEAAAGAQAGTRDYQAARDELGDPSDTVVRLGLSHAAVDAADFATAARLGAGARTLTGGYPSVLAESAGDPDRAAGTLASLRTGRPEVIHPDPGVAAFLNRLVAVPDGAAAEIVASLRTMAQAKGGFSRGVMRGSLLLGLDERSAALRIARSASERRPEYRDAWNLRAAAGMARGDYEDARRAVDISLDLDPGFGYSWYLKSLLEEKDGDRGKADEYRLRAKLLGFTAEAGS